MMAQKAKSRLDNRAAWYGARWRNTVGWDSGRYGDFFLRLDRFQDIVHMAWHLKAAPFFFQGAVRADQEGAALDAFDLFAVHDLVFDHAEHVAHFLFGVSDQLKRQFQFGLELVMRAHVVTRHTKYGGARLDKVLVT